jgi:hypothetical protein
VRRPGTTNSLSTSSRAQKTRQAAQDANCSCLIPLSRFPQIADLIHELLVIEIWREEVFPKLVAKLSKLAELKAYMTVSLHSCCSLMLT